MDQKIDNTSPEAIRTRLSPDIRVYAKLSEEEREAYDVRWHVYVERALYVLLMEGKLDQATDETEPLSVSEVGWLSRMAHFIVDRHHAFGTPMPFGSCLSPKQFETVIRSRDGGEKISHLANILSGVARKRKLEYNEQEARTEEPGPVSADGDTSGSQAPASEHAAFGAIVKESGRTKAARGKP